jgi:hypothetical protein
VFARFDSCTGEKDFMHRPETPETNGIRFGPRALIGRYLRRDSNWRDRFAATR